MEYDLELKKAITEAKKSKAKTIVVQLPDGLKPQAKYIVDEMQKATNATIYIWGGSCFGACDIPLEVEKLGADMIIQWGHAQWRW